MIFDESIVYLIAQANVNPAKDRRFSDHIRLFLQRKCLRFPL